MVKTIKSKIREHFDYVYPDAEIEIGLPMTPATWDEEEALEITPALYIQLGGVQCSQVEYIIGTDLYEFVKNKRLTVCQRYTGEDIILNTENIIKVFKISIVTVKYNSENPNFEKGIWEDKYLIKRNTKVKLKK